jgi:hypothetical protein
MMPTPLLLLLVCSLLTGCASITPPPGRETNPTPKLAQRLSDEGPQRLHRRRGSREAVTRVGPGRSSRPVHRAWAIGA